MKVINQSAHININGFLSLNVQTGLPETDVDIVIVINTQKKNYNFTDLIGKLNWEGDSVNEQKKLRNEW